jgi:hypothetical protein
LRGDEGIRWKLNVVQGGGLILIERIKSKTERKRETKNRDGERKGEAEKRLIRSLMKMRWFNSLACMNI